MKRWRYQNQRDAEDQNYERYGKIRRGRRTLKQQKQYAIPFELDEGSWKEVPEKGVFAARVVEVHKRYAFISPETDVGVVATKDVWLATIARRYLTAARQERNFVAVGDRVLCRPAGENDPEVSLELPQCVILHQAPRQSTISRIDPAQPDRRHILAANLDQLLVVASYLKPSVKWGLIDRYLVLAESQNIPAVIVLNKSDLLASEGRADFVADAKARLDWYRQCGYEVLSIQATAEDVANSQAFKRLEQLLSGKVTLLSGHSGVGKSSLVNLFAPEIEQDVEPNEDIFYKGRHTTSYASLIKLDLPKSYVVDTPGVRSFCIEDHSAINLTYYFRDLRSYMGKCHYRECRHIEEPDCAVLTAVKDQKIPDWRYRSYLGILLGATGREGRLRDISLHE